MANFHRPNLEGSFDMNSTGVRQGEERSKYSALLEAWSSFGDTKAQLDGLEKRVDGVVLLSQSHNSATRLLSSSKPRSSHEVRRKDHQGPSPQRGLRVVKHKQSSRQKRARHKEKENGKKARRVEAETDKARKEESTVIVEGCVLNSDSQLNETFTVTPELDRALPQEHADTERGTQEGSVAAGEDAHDPSRRMLFEQANEPTEAQTSPRRAVQTAVSPLPLQRTNKSAVFGPPISFKGDGSDVPGQGRQQGHSDRQQDRRDERNVQQHAVPAHFPNRMGLGPRGVLREFAMPSVAALDSLQEEAARQQHAVRETAAVVQNLLRQPPLQPRSVSTWRGESHPFDTAASTSKLYKGTRQDASSVVRKVCLSPEKSAAQGRYSDTAPPAGFGEGQVTGHTLQHDPFVTCSRHFAHNPPLYSNMDPPVQPQQRKDLHATALEPGKSCLGAEYWKDPFTQDPAGRKRKVALVPPPQPPVGMAVGRRGREETIRAAPSSSQGHGAPARSEERQNPPQALNQRSTAPKAAVRKVAKQKHPQHSKRGPEKTITPFSWRAGKELSDRVLSVLQRIEPAKEPHRSPHSLRSSAASQPRSSQSGAGSSVHLIHPHQPSPSHHSAEVNAVKLLADMDQEPSEDEMAGKGEEPKRQQGKSERGGRRKVSGPPKRPKYNFEPVYNIPKTRHYCSADVQQYMQRKKEEKKKVSDEHKRAALRQKQLREQRLQELSQARKERLNVNLANVYSRQTRPEMTFLKRVAAGLSQPTSESMETPSCSDMEELVMEQSQPRPLTQHPAYERERAQPSSGPSPTKRSDLPPLSPSSSQSDTCTNEDTPTGSELEEVPLLVNDERPKGREGAETGDLPPMPRASTMTMSGLSAVGHPLGPIAQPHSLLGAKGSQAKQDRLRALTISALTLKAKMEMERKRILEASRLGIIPDWRAQETPVHASTRSGTSPAGVSPSSSPRRSIGTNTEQQLTEYPGVGNLDAHVLAMRRERKERSAATNIQAAFRGYVVRKALRSTERWPKSGAEHVEDEGAKLNTGACGRSAGLSEGFVASEELSRELGSTTTLPTAPPTSLGTGEGEGLQPWEQRGGDVHSLVHIIAKQETRRRRKAAERASSVHQVGAAGENVGVQVNIVEVNTAGTDWSGNRRGARVRSENEGSGSVAGHGKPHTSPSIPVKGDAVSPGQLRSPTATPQAQQVSLTATPPAQTVSLTATPPVQPVSSTATPPVQPVSSTATPPTQPISSTATPPVQPVNSTATPSVQPVSSTATPPAQPVILTATPPVQRVILTATPLAQPDSVTSTPSTSVVSMEPDSLAEEGTSTLEASHMYHVQDRAGMAPTGPPGENEAEETGRLSPRSLQLKLSAELMLLETAQDQMQHLGDVERARYVALAQRETLSVAQVLKNAHEEEIRSLSAKTELELEAVRQQLQLAQGEASTAAVRVESLERQTRGEMDRNAQLMAKLEREAHESQLQLAEARKAASVAVIAAARKQLEGAHELATQTAIGAAKAAVEAALAGQREMERHTSSEVESCSESTPSLDEGGSKHGTRSNTEEESLSASDSQTPTEYSSGKERAVEASSEDDVPEDLDSTLVTEVVEEEKSKSTTSSTVQEGTAATNSHAVSPVKSQTAASLLVVTPLSHGGAVLDARQEPDEVSFRMVLPSECHRRRQRQDRRPLSPRLSLSSSITSDMASPSPSSSPSASSVLLPDETGVPKELSHASVLSGGEESFDDFTLRMIRQYVKDQDTRARHQMALLKLKEKALEEQTKAKLTVLDQWKRRLKKKGGDDHMPAVLKKEKGLMKNYKNTKAEIRSLWLVQHQEKEERQRLLLQEREIGNLRLSAQSYWEKARLLEEDEGRNVSVSVSSVSPVSCVSGKLESPLQVKPSFPPFTSTPFEKTKSPVSEQTSISEEVPEEEEGEGEGDVIEVFEKTDVTESLAEQTSVLRTVSSAPSTSQAEGSREVDRSGKSVTEEPSCRLSVGDPLGSNRSEGEEGPPPAGSQDRDREITRSTTTPSTVEEYPLVHRLTKTDYTTTERRLAKREEQLQRQQKMAEGAVAAQQRLLEKEKQLRQKEEQISFLLDQAEELRTQRLGLSTRTTGASQRKGDSIRDRSSEKERSPQKSDSVRMRNWRDSLEEEEAPSGEGKVPEEVLPPSSLTTTSIAEVLSAHPAQGAESVISEVSEDIKSGRSKGFGEYSHDTFESITTAAGVLTSTPYSCRRDQQATRDDVSSPRQISESPTDVTTISSVTTATESSEIEQRIRQLKGDLSQRKEEVRRVQQEQKRRKRGLLQEKEEQLKKKLKALEQKLQGAKQSLSHVVPSNVSVHSTTATESEGEREQQTSLRRERQRHRAHAGGDTTARLPRSVEPSLSYTPFTDDQAVEERFSPAKTSKSDNQSTLVIGEDITLTSPQMQDESIKTAGVEDESIKTAGVEDESIKTARMEDESVKTVGVEDEFVQTAGVEDESIKTAGVEDDSIKTAGVENETAKISVVEDESTKTAGVEDKSIKTAGVEDKSVKTAGVEDESATLTISHKAKSALLVEEKPLSARRTGAIPLVSSVKSPPLSSAHSVEDVLHSSSLSSPRRSTKSLAGRASGKLSPGGSPSRIPIPSRLVHSPQSGSPATSLKSLQSKHSPTSPQKGKASEVLSDQEETLRDAHSYSESFTAVSESHREQEETANIVKTALAPSAEEETTTEGEEEEEEVLTEMEEQLLSSGASEAELTGSPSLLAEEGSAALAPSALQQDQVASGATAAMGVEGGVPEVEPSQAVDVFNQLVEGLQVGQRVLVGGAVAGVVRFVGGVHFTSGIFIGVELDEGKGKNDGSFDGVRYFDCPEGHGLFAPPSIVSLLQEEKGDSAGGIAHESPEEEEEGHLFEHKRTSPEALQYPTEGVRSPSTESPTPSEVSSLDVEEVVPSDLEEEEEDEGEESVVEKQRKEKTLASLEKLHTVNGVANGLMRQLMKELMVDVSAAAQKKRTLAIRKKQRRAMADSITSDLLAAFLQSEVHLMCNIRNAKKAALEEESAHEEPLAEVPAKPSHLPLAARGVLPLAHLSASPSHKLSPEPSSLSPPPSPPGSPPRYSARAFAGDRSPPPTLPPDTSHPHVGVAQAERPMSPVSISSLMEEHPFSDIELTILPRDKASVDKIAETAWNDYLNATQEQKDAGTPFKTPKSVLAVRSLSSQPSHLITDEEQVCRDSFGHLVYQLAVAVIRELQPGRANQYSFRQSISWKMKRERRKSLVDPPLTLDNIKQIVFARLVEGRLPIRLPKGRYHHGMRRPGGKEVDFLEAVLIKELRADERRWTDFEGEERDIKLKTADRILDLLLDEVVQEVKAIGHKKSHTASH